VFNYLKKIRMTDSVVKALTTFHQRRLLKHQVENSFLLRPLARKDLKFGKGKKGDHDLDRADMT
jgi:hypothetical protein